MSEKKPRWIDEIPKPNKIKQKRELTYEEKKESKKFEDAINSGNIEEWFRKK